MSKQDFTKLFRTGKRVRGKRCSIQYGPLSTIKVAAVVQAKAVASAVDRNRIRRGVYQAFDKLLKRVKRPVWVVAVVHKAVLGPEMTLCTEEMESLMKKSGIIE
jgi:ribonuclease P protein component